MKTRVSVIIPVYNVQEFLEDCLDSVLNQSINNMELTDGYERNLQIIIVDDGSTDDSSLIAKNYAEEHDNIEYVYEENQGLGHARNYGCKFAVGDYIIFLDSDDMVAPKAYERMYKAAIKNNSDMTVGMVWRFNSKRYWTIKLHEIAFSGTKDVTHITESPELFYDTTSWNKLIKRTFWDKHQFGFPEGMLYEDIPVAIPMHYLANNVSVIYDECYFWRVREGIAKSITQTTDDMKNLKDRLSAMKMVDEFFDKNVTEKELFKTKNTKWLRIDLMIFINKLVSISTPEAEQSMNALLEYVEKNFDQSDFESLNEFERLKYEYLLDHDLKRLVDELTFELEELKTSEIYYQNSHLMMDLDEETLNRPSICIDKFIKDERKISYLTKVSLDKNKLTVEGFTIIPGLEDKSFDDREYSFQLVNSDSHKRIPLKSNNIKINNFKSFKIPYNDNFSYEASGYKVSVPYNELINNPDFMGENKLLVTFKQEGVIHNYFAGAAKGNVRATSKLKGKVYENHYFGTDFNLNRELVVNISTVKHVFEEVAIEDQKLCIHSPENNGDIFLCYDEDSVNPEIRIPFNYDDNGKYYYIDIDSISENEGQIRYDNNEPIVYKKKKLVYLPSDKGQIIINGLRDHYFDIRKTDNITVISKIFKKRNKIKISANLFSVFNDKDKFNSATLYCKNEMDFEVHQIATCNSFDKNGYLNFSFKYKDANITENLYHGIHDVYVLYDFGDVSFSTPVYTQKMFKFKYSVKAHDYQIYRGGKSTLRIRSRKKWLPSEDTKMKRKKIVETKYSRYNRLPIHKKQIFFESMWGKNYSCNPRYLYEYVDKYYPDYKCVWSFLDENTPIKGNGIKVKRDSAKYYYYLATSKYLVSNVDLNDNFVKRNEQIYIQTMHGTPLKTIGLDVTSLFKTKKNRDDFIKKCECYDYIPVQSDFVGDISRRCYLFDKELLKCGYPRTDILYTKNNKEDILKIKEKLGLPLDKKVILYAPTWRLKNKFDLMIDLDSFRQSFSDEYVMILRLHHYAMDAWKPPENNDFVYDFSKYDTIEELYLISDIFITDYSSAMFDYSILDRPILLYTYDLYEYHEKLRGLYFDIKEKKPGPILFTSEEVEDAIKNIDDIEEEYKECRKKFQEEFIHYECENSSEQIFNKLTSNNDDSVIKKLFKNLKSKRK